MIRQNTQSIKVFCDGADYQMMVELAARADVHGMTTNPTLMRKAGIADYRSFCKKVLAQVKDKPISFEVFADDPDQMIRQAREIASWGKNVYVKIPVMNSEGRSTATVIRTLSAEGVSLNITAVLTTKQVIEAADALKDGPAGSVVSVFAGRIADTGRDPVPVMAAALEICRTASTKIELLWASTREAYNLIQAEQIGCDIITVPFDILKKRSLFGKDLNQLSLETVRMFKSDAEQSGFEL